MGGQVFSFISRVHTEIHLLEKLITRAWTRSLGPCERIREDEFSSNWPSNDRVETPRFLGVLNDDPRSFQKTRAVAPSEQDHFRKLKKLIWPCAGHLALHPLPIHVGLILHSGATQSLYGSAETEFLAPYLSAFCHLFGGDWYAGRIMVLLVNPANHLSCPTCIEQQEIRQVIWLNFAFCIGQCWNLAIMFVCLHSLPIFIQYATWGHTILSVLIPELTSSVDKNSSFLVPIFIVWTRTLVFTLSREVISRAVHSRVNTAIVKWTPEYHWKSTLVLFNRLLATW